MLRRRIAEEPISRFAIWARRLAVFSILVMLLAILIVRSGFIETIPALSTVASSLFLAFVAIVLAFAAFIVIWRNGNRGLGHAVAALLIGFLMFAYPGYLAVRAYQLPAINDITTDPMDPPRFEAVARLRPRDANPIAYGGLPVAELQHAAYRDIEPLFLSNTPQEAYDVVLDVINKRKWRVVDARAPQSGRREGLIEAIARTPIMGFRDDVAIRIRPDPEGARVDIRSASRYGKHDFGTNASRVRALLSDIDDLAGADIPKKFVPKPVKAPQPQAKAAHAPAKR